MRRLMVAGLLLSGFLLSTDAAQAFGGRRGDNCGAASVCGGGCGTAYEDRVMTGQRAVTKSRVVKKEVTEYVSKTVQEPYTYTVMENVTTQEKRTVTTYETQWVDEAYTYTVCEPVTTQEKRTVTEYRNVAKQVPYTYNVCTPTTVTEMRTVSRWVCTPETVTENVTRTHRVPVCSVDPCTGCARTCYQRVTECVPVTRTVMRRRCVTEQVPVTVTKYVTTQQTGTRTVYECVPTTKDVMVNVTKYVNKEMKGTRKVCKVVPKTSEVMVNVVSCKPVQKTGTITKCVTEPVKKMADVTEYYTEMENYTYTVRVPVAAAATTVSASGGCDACCADDCGRARGCRIFGGGRLFGGRLCGGGACGTCCGGCN